MSMAMQPGRVADDFSVVFCLLCYYTVAISALQHKETH